MGQFDRLGALPLGVLFLFVGNAGAQMLGTSARQLPAGSLKTLVYYQGTQGQDLNFALTGGGTCAAGANAPASNVTFPCTSTGNVAAKGSGGAMILKLIYQPWENVQYYASVGAGDYSLRVASVSVVNSLTGDRPGFLYTFGAKALLWPDTSVSGAVLMPAIALDASIGLQRYYFNGFQPAVTPAASQVSQRLDMVQMQLALEASHLFKFEGTRWQLEPYGGLKWYRTQAWLKDLQAGGRIGGMRDTVSPFLGLTIPVYEKEGLFVEASFIDGVYYAAGWNVRFR